MEDQGIMALPQGQAMQGPTAQPAAPQMDPAAMAAFEQARMQIDPKEFGDSLLSEAANADPATVQAFIQLLRSANLPPEVIDALGQMVDAVLAEPEKYAEIRAAFIREGVPEDILPPTFDAAFFAALNMALDQMSTSTPMPQQFAKGGIAQLNPIAGELAKMGRKGDTMLAHITPSEARLLRRRGGSGTMNPRTGLPEFFLGSIAKAVGGVFKSVGNAVSGAVKGVVNGIKDFVKSDIGRVVTAVALGFFLGPAAAGLIGVTSAAGVAAVSGFVGGFGSSMLAGQGLKNSLKMGAVGALTAGATAGITGGAEAFQSSGLPPPSPGEAISQQWNKFTGGLESLAGKPVATLPDTTTMAQANVAPPVDQAIQPPQFVATQPGAGVDVAGTAQNIGSVPGTPSGQISPDYSLSQIDRIGMNQGLQPSMGQGLRGTADSLYQVGKVSGAPMGMGEGIMSAAKNIGAGEFGQAASDLGQTFFGSTPRTIGTGITTLALTGGFTPKQPKPPGIVPTETGFDLLRRQPEVYGVTPGGAQVVYLNPFAPTQYAKGGIAAVSPRRYAIGGYASGGIKQFPRRTGQIDGPGTGTSDSIPAMLSDGEFVMTAKAVRGAGKGSRREGARKMYAMMKALERKSNG